MHHNSVFDACYRSNIANAFNSGAPFLINWFLTDEFLHASRHLPICKAQSGHTMNQAIRKEVLARIMTTPVGMSAIKSVTLK